jgi:hypothetical protein
MWQRKTTGVVALVLGVVLFTAGIVDHEIIAPKNALCQSPVGQIGQAFDNTVQHDCGLVTTLESLVGWLLALGILGALLGVIVLYRSGQAPRPSAYPPAPSYSPPAAPAPAMRPQPPMSPGAAAPTIPPRPAAPPRPQPPAAPETPASRPWWEQP